MDVCSTRRPTRSTPGRAVVAIGALVAVAAVAVTACRGGSDGAAAPITEPSGSAGATSAAMTAPAGADGPPVALASVEGGDPVQGQLGTYTWAGNGSDAPWLQGAPISVGRGEVLGVAFDPLVDVSSWSARFVPLGRDGPAGGHPLGQGRAPIRVGVPPPGAWTVLLSVDFADGLGTASYAWAVTVG